MSEIKVYPDDNDNFIIQVGNGVIVVSPEEWTRIKRYVDVLEIEIDPSFKEHMAQVHKEYMAKVEEDYKVICKDLPEW